MLSYQARQLCKTFQLIFALPTTILLKRHLILILLFFLTACAQAADYYWVGGSGNWSDISHWAATSGGNVTYPSAPTSEDNVIFDNNSFTGPNQTVNFSTDIIFFRNMDWSTVTNMPTLDGPENVIVNIFGDLNFSANMTVNFEGQYKFTGEVGPKNIELAGHNVQGSMLFSGESDWTFQSPVVIDSMLHVINGNLYFNDQDVEMRFFYITTDNPKTIDLGNSEIRITGKYLDEYANDRGSRSFQANLNNLTLIPGNSRIDFTADDATFYHFGNGVLDFNIVTFSANTGRVLMSSDWYTNLVDINELTFMSNATIEGVLAADNLRLTGGNVYIFDTDRSYEFGGIEADGNCSRGVVITSNNNSVNTTFNVAAGIVEIEYLTLRDIHAAGGATFMANNSVDLGNNDGWTFTNSNPVSYYWIGGAGNWTDGMHWSFTSGGTPSGCIPSGKDDVFFDANSFTAANQAVTLNRPNLYVHDMTWSGVTDNPILEGDIEFTLNLTGSLEFDANMQHLFEGNYDFESNEIGNTIRTNGIIFNRNINFSGLDGTWEFLDNIEITNFLSFISGQLSTNGFDVTLMRFYSYSEYERFLDISNSYVLLRNVADRNPTWEVDIENFNLNTSNSTLYFEAPGADLRHRGDNYGPIVLYNNVIFQTSTANVESENYAIDEDQPSISVNNLEFFGRGNIEGTNHIASLRLASGYDYGLDPDPDRRQLVDAITTFGTCGAGLTQIYSQIPSYQANLDLNANYDLDQLYFRDINVRGASITATNSVDGGNNENINFIDAQGRTLYWVGNEGLWQEMEHWSLSSGGPGGECIPTAIDDVIFDENSFTLENQVVDAPPSYFSYCHDIIWTNSFGNPRLAIGILNVHGSLVYDQSFVNAAYITQFSSRETETVISQFQTFNRIQVRGEGTIIFADDLDVYNFSQRAGNIIFDDIEANLGVLEFFNPTAKRAEFGASRITIYESGGTPFSDNTESLVILPGTSEFNFTGNRTALYSRSNINLHNVIFSSTQGSGTIISRIRWNEDDFLAKITTNSLRFNGNGQIVGNIETDTLIGAAGKIYTLESGREQIVNSHLQLLGNNCTPIELTSSTNSGKASITMPNDAIILADFVQMRNNIGQGGATFNAGARSIDIANSNEGWTFEDAPDFIEIGFLGNDGALCDTDELELSAFSYSLGEQYLWSDGSTDSILVVNSAGTYFVEVQFESECILRDTIEVFEGMDVIAELPEEAGLCNGQEVLLNAGVPINIATYTWSNGSTDSTVLINSPGTYIVEMDVNGCISSDSTLVRIVEDPGLDLGSELLACEDEVFEISSGISANSYLWSDGSTDSIYSGSQAGIVNLEINSSGCIFTDSVLVQLLDRPELELGRDTAICQGSTIAFEIETGPDDILTWNDILVSDLISVIDSGSYKASIDRNGCIVHDTIQISVISNPEVDLGPQIVSCEGQEVILSVPDPNADFIWENGSRDMDRIVTTAGVYKLEVTQNECQASDSIVVAFIPLPQLNLGVDTLVCDDVPFILQPISKSQGELIWPDSSNANSYVVESPGMISVLIQDGQCTNVDSIQVQFEKCTYFEHFIPNIFSPNEDGINDLFQINFPPDLLVEEFQISIFDRWGNNVFQSKAVDDSWNGLTKGGQAENGVYTYKIDISYIDDRGPGTDVIFGDVTVLK